MIGTSTNASTNYDAVPALRWTQLKRMRRSARHFQFWRNRQESDGPAKLLGRALHCRVLEPGRYKEQFAVYDGGDRRGKDWTAFKRANEGLDILKTEEHELVESMAEAVMAHPRAAALLEDAPTRECPIVWTDPATGIVCKCRPDALGPAVLLDLKTTRCWSAYGFTSDAVNSGYHCQLAFYLRGIWHVTGTTPEPYLVAIEKDPPHEVGVWHVSGTALAAGDDEVGRLLQRVAECEKSGIWPGAYPEEREFTLPNWALLEDGPATGMEVDHAL